MNHSTRIIQRESFNHSPTTHACADASSFSNASASSAFAAFLASSAACSSSRRFRRDAAFDCSFSRFFARDSCLFALFFPRADELLSRGDDESISLSDDTVPPQNELGDTDAPPERDGRDEGIFTGELVADDPPLGGLPFEHVGEDDDPTTSFPFPATARF
jgi:hypothetical protein